MRQWVYNFEPLFTCTFPAVVCPEPIRRLALDSFFQFAEIHLGDFKLLTFFGFVGQKFEFSFIVATFYSLHIQVVYSKVGFYGYFLCTSEHGSVMV